MEKLKTLVAFYINFCMHNEPPLLGVFQKIYQLKGLPHIHALCLPQLKAWTLQPFLMKLKQSKTNVALSRKTTTKKTNKRPRLEESTQETGSSECPPLTRHRSEKEPALIVTCTSLVFALPEAPIPPMEPVHKVDSLIHIYDPLLIENLTKATPLIQLVVSLSNPQYHVSFSEAE
ncbi:hypothetical protein V6Z11_A06G159600 [Gossypium hirsutum]